MGALCTSFSLGMLSDRTSKAILVEWCGAHQTQNNDMETKKNEFVGLSGELSRQTTDHTWSASKLLRPKEQSQQVPARLSPAEVAGVSRKQLCEPEPCAMLWEILQNTQ